MAIVSLTWAEEYFSKHLFADAWKSTEQTKKEAALVHAERDIKTLSYPRGPGGPSLGDLRSAVCEQALFLLNQTAPDRERKKAQESGVKYRWVGDAREDYTGSPALIAPEALRILGHYVIRRAGGIN